jgi:HAD superfamily hydrolase (TIGR01509 family)
MTLVIFDCDGVLIDSEIIAARVEAEAYSALGYAMSAEAFSARFCGLTHDAIARLIEAEMGRPLPAGFSENVATTFARRIASELTVVDGARDAVSALPLPRCVASNAGSAYLVRTLTQVNLVDLFTPNIFAAREVGNRQPKPDANVFRHAAEAMGNGAGATIVIEDSVHGVEAARAAGMRVVGFTGASHAGDGHAERLRAAGAITTVPRMADLPAVVMGLVEA